MPNVTKKNAESEINLLDFFEILGISCGHQGKAWDKIFFSIHQGVYGLLLFKVLSFLHTRLYTHVHISESINAMTMKQVSLESSWTQDSIF